MELQFDTELGDGYINFYIQLFVCKLEKYTCT